jgi:hypothetical protein
MKIHRFWVEIVMVGTAVACGLALLLATLGAATGAAIEAFGQTQTASVTTERTYEGMVTCSRCGARHSAKLGETASDCTRKCVRIGAQFALIDGDNIYLLEGDLNSLKKVAGERARITGSAAGNTIRVSSVIAGD